MNVLLLRTLFFHKTLKLLLCFGNALSRSLIIRSLTHNSCTYQHLWKYIYAGCIIRLA